MRRSQISNGKAVWGQKARSDVDDTLEADAEWTVSTWWKRS
jgi:hypothetical protein